MRLGQLSNLDCASIQALLETTPKASPISWSKGLAFHCSLNFHYRSAAEVRRQRKFVPVARPVGFLQSRGHYAMHYA